MSALTHLYPGRAVTCMRYRSGRSRRCRSLGGVRRRLTSFHASRGRPCHLVPLPVPRTVCSRGKRELPTACTGFLIIGKTILVPACERPICSRRTRGTLRGTFPRRRVMNVSYHILVQRRNSLRYYAVRFPISALGAAGRAG